jgi:hypothetical protein
MINKTVMGAHHMGILIANNIVIIKDIESEDWG